MESLECILQIRTRAFEIAFVALVEDHTLHVAATREPLHEAPNRLQRAGSITAHQYASRENIQQRRLTAAYTPGFPRSCPDRQSCLADTSEK